MPSRLVVRRPAASRLRDASVLPWAPASCLVFGVHVPCAGRHKRRMCAPMLCQPQHASAARERRSAAGRARLWPRRSRTCARWASASTTAAGPAADRLPRYCPGPWQAAGCHPGCCPGLRQAAAPLRTSVMQVRAAREPRGLLGRPAWQGRGAVCCRRLSRRCTARNCGQHACIASPQPGTEAQTAAADGLAAEAKGLVLGAAARPGPRAQGHRRRDFVNAQRLGRRAQVCNNLALAGQMAATAEGLALGARLGLDPALLSAVMNASSARCWSCEQYNPAPVRRARGCRSVVVASCAGVPG